MTPSAPDAHGAPGRIRLFGDWLATDRSLPGLPVASGAGTGQPACWHLNTVDADTLPVGHTAQAQVRGRLEYSGGVTVTLASVPVGDEIVFSDTGRFTLPVDGHGITHIAPPGVDRAAVALDLIGVVLPTLLHRSGAWCLHASAIQTPAGVIAFVAERGTGKSTLAAACVQDGCALVADDVVVLRESDDGVVVIPSGAPLRLRASAARAVGGVSDDADHWGKVRVASALAHESMPIAAIYVLQATAPDAEVARVPRDVRAASLALLAHGKITALLGSDGAGEAMSRCVSLAHHTRVYDLAVPRDIERIGAVAAQLLRWHPAAARHEVHA